MKYSILCLCGLFMFSGIIAQNTDGPADAVLPAQEYGISAFLEKIQDIEINRGSEAEEAYSLESLFENPPEQARPWTLWYWMYAAVSEEGITADLEALHDIGMRGAYIVCIFDENEDIPFHTPAPQHSPQWWKMVNHALKEAKRLNMKLGFHMSDGFALAGGPWITPDLSMQKLVWNKKYIGSGGKKREIQLDQPETKEGYYEDLAVYAYPTISKSNFKKKPVVPKVTTSTGENADYLVDEDKNSETFRSNDSAWIQYEYRKPFTLRSLVIRSAGNNYQSRRLLVQSSKNGKDFETVIRLRPPRHGWQDTDEDYTFSIPETKARYFRFVFDKTGSEAGSEDLDAAKWKPTLKIRGIYPGDEPVIHQIEAKNGSMWRVAENTDSEWVPDHAAVPFSEIIDLTDKMDKDGRLDWKPQRGNWTVVRIGHTSTGHRNDTGGAAKGLECDKFNPEAVSLQFDNWFGKVFEKTDPGLAEEVLQTFYIDSWEAGSQNWSRTFPQEFERRRGYDLMPYLLVMTGVPVESAGTSERILHDVRETAAELVNDIFYKTLRKLSAEKGCDFTAESVAPTMVSDGLLHYQTVDYPMGEFWVNSPTHDKPNDMLDAVSAARIYGKNIVQAEAFTTVRMDWTEHPGNLKSIADRNFALGMNRVVFHVNTLNPWLDRKPGMTLNGVGLYFQRDQPWFHQAKSWINYFSGISAFLQEGRPMADIAVFTGEEIPRRSVLPDRLVSALPGIFGAERVAAEKIRLENMGQPQRTIPHGVTHSANMADPEDWTDALRGYKYDSFNPDALLKSTVQDGKLVMPSGNEYSVVVFPGVHAMNPNPHLMSLPVARKILELKEGGVQILLDPTEKQIIGYSENEEELKKIWKEITGDRAANIWNLPYEEETFEPLGISRDMDATSSEVQVAWTHRKLYDAGGDIYFISNPTETAQVLKLSFRVSGKEPEIGDPVTGQIYPAPEWFVGSGRTFLTLPVEAGESFFVIFRKSTDYISGSRVVLPRKKMIEIGNGWIVNFDPEFGGPEKPVLMNELELWNRFENDSIRYYSGTAVYENEFIIEAGQLSRPVFLQLDSLFNIASVSINGMDCGTLWTKPFRLDISTALRPGSNKISLRVSNTWYNRLSYDRTLPESQRVTWTIAPTDFMEGRPLQNAGLSGKILLEY